jgi:hypothetical protein
MDCHLSSIEQSLIHRDGVISQREYARENQNTLVLKKYRRQDHPLLAKCFLFPLAKPLAKPSGVSSKQSYAVAVVAQATVAPTAE